MAPLKDIDHLNSFSAKFYERVNGVDTILATHFLILRQTFSDLSVNIFDLSLNACLVSCSRNFYVKQT